VAWQHTPEGKTCSDIHVRAILSKDYGHNFKSENSYIKDPKPADKVNVYLEQERTTVAQCSLKSVVPDNIKSAICTLAMAPKYLDEKEALGYTEYRIEDGLKCSNVQPSVFNLGGMFMVCYWRGACDTAPSSTEWSLVCQLLWLRIGMNAIRPHQESLKQVKLQPCPSNATRCNEQGLTVATYNITNGETLEKAKIMWCSSDRNIVKIHYKSTSGNKYKSFNVARRQLVTGSNDANPDDLVSYTTAIGGGLMPAYVFEKEPTADELKAAKGISRNPIAHLVQISGTSNCELWTGLRDHVGQSITGVNDRRLAASMTIGCSINDVRLTILEKSFKYCVNYKSAGKIYNECFKGYSKDATGMKTFGSGSPDTVAANGNTVIYRKHIYNPTDNRNVGWFLPTIDGLMIKKYNIGISANFVFNQKSDDCTGLISGTGRCWDVSPSGKFR
jgi:hypothetical protein